MVLRRLKNLGHLLLALFANIYYGFPSRKVTVIGVTGTDGKSTTVHLLYHILKESGRKVSMVSTIRANIGDSVIDTGFHTTTPNPCLIQKLLRKSANLGDEFFILEVTSHALDQNRIFGVRFTMGILTNITPEHLDYHKDLDSYIKTKSLLLLRSKLSFINRDDSSAIKVREILNKYKKKWHEYSVHGNANLRKYIEQEIPSAIGFNRYNYIAAYDAAIQLGVKPEDVKRALKTFRLPEGRLEVVFDKKFKVIVDFAHTPNAIQNALDVVRSHHIRKGKRLIHVFGAAGLRDSQKRPSMGENSSRFSDGIILTEEDYRTEDPLEISAQIAKGIEKNGWVFIPPEKMALGGDKKYYTIIVDRKKAIEKALSIAQKGDVIVITGKGHEQSLCRGKKEFPWSDRKTVQEMVVYI